MPKISVFPVPRFIDLTFLSLQVLSKNVLYFRNLDSKTGKPQVAVFVFYNKMVPKKWLRKVSLQMVSIMG